MPPKKSVGPYLGCRVDVECEDDTTITGRLLAYDKQLNVVLGDAERVTVTSRKQGSSTTSKRARENLGTLILRGETVRSVGCEASVVSGPSVVTSQRDKKAAEAKLQTARSYETALQAPIAGLQRGGGK